MKKREKKKFKKNYCAQKLFLAAAIKKCDEKSQFKVHSKIFPPFYNNNNNKKNESTKTWEWSFKNIFKMMMKNYNFFRCNKK